MKRPLRLALAGLVVLLAVDGELRADDGVPALLQFAEQYQQQRAPAAKVEQSRAATERKTTENRPAVGKSPTPPAATSTAFVLRRTLQERDEQLARQRAALNALQQELAALRAQALAAAPKQPALPDLTLLQQWLGGLRQAWQGSPDAQRSATLLQQASGQLAQLQRQHAEDRARYARDRQDWQRQIAALQQWTLTPEQLKDQTNRLSYAAGSALGGDIQQLMSERQSWGVPVDRNSLLAGVLDTVSGRPLLPPGELSVLMAKADSMANAARQQVVKKRTQQDRQYVAQFSQQKGVKRSPMGFWYRVDYAGDRPLAKDAVIEVVVKEQLTDGSVVQDMELSGKVLAQPLSAYPPLFREAISQLNNHGSLTMVVPPELAYGETGYPPKVPPNATMVYQLRIDNSQEP
ncbi:FKBP-type peptidyl-prolyl cis-trans isomerase N-terminal domain-containing protein [Serratia odorifera]|uniref:FKBP-type peptidyl-prolyl cis-trans isomerase N-terminal domain-containing protein n=1 Tax=Serratia odorifera TaxID=618 RepID=UPI002360CB2A|nr:FKBP-type peptidyl-prolyl cis-trans isomerase N-terminal domain-containing protein [Serratia odorifera]